MKIITLLSVLIFIVCSACNKDSFNKDLLIGDWKLKQSDYSVYSPTVSFNSNGEYKMVEYINYPFSTTIFNIGTITGEYITYDDKIEFTTATIELETATAGSSDNLITGGSSVSYYNNWNNDSVLRHTDTRRPFSISGYKPVIWTVIELTEDNLKATRSLADTLAYVKN